MSARVTVFCPIYNDEKYVNDFVPSVLRQTLTDFEFLILENGSQDGTRDRLRRFLDPRIRLVHAHRNFRSETAVNVLDGIQSEYIAQIYSDDAFLPQKLERSLSILEDTGVSACFSNNIFIDEDGDPIPNREVPVSQFSGDISAMTPHEHLHNFLFRGNSLHPVSMVIRRDAYHRVGGIRGFMHQIGDMEFFTRLLLQEPVAFIKEPLQKIRLRSGGRNESSHSDATVAKIRGERINFIQNFRSPEALSQIDDIFIPSARGIKIPERLKLWFLGQQFVNVPEPDYRYFGINCLYDALRLNGTQFLAELTAVLGMPPGAYVDQLSGQIFADYGRQDSSKDSDITSLKSKLSSVEKDLERERAASELVQSFGVLGKPYSLGTTISLSSSESNRFVVGGFSDPEEWGRWTIGHIARLRLSHPPIMDDLSLRLVPVMAFQRNSHACTIEVSVNRGPVSLFDLTTLPTALDIVIPSGLLNKDRTIDVSIFIREPKKHDEKPTEDMRALGVGFESVRLDSVLELDLERAADLLRGERTEGISQR